MIRIHMYFICDKNHKSIKFRKRVRCISINWFKCVNLTLNFICHGNIYVLNHFQNSLQPIVVQCFDHNDLEKGNLKINFCQRLNGMFAIKLIPSKHLNCPNTRLYLYRDVYGKLVFDESQNILLDASTRTPLSNWIGRIQSITHFVNSCGVYKFLMTSIFWPVSILSFSACQVCG